MNTYISYRITVGPAIESMRAFFIFPKNFSNLRVGNSYPLFGHSNPAELSSFSSKNRNTDVRGGHLAHSLHWVLRTDTVHVRPLTTEELYILGHIISHIHTIQTR